MLLAPQLQWKFKFFFAFVSPVFKATGDLFLFFPFYHFRQKCKWKARTHFFLFFSVRRRLHDSESLKKSLELSHTARHKMCMKKFVLQESQTGVRRGKIVIRNFFVILKPAFVSPKRLEIVFFSHYRLPACSIFLRSERLS